MQLRKSERKKAKIKLALQGSAGSGKTYSSLQLGKGLTNNNLSKVAIVDSESGSADLYADIGDYNVLSLAPPFTPQKYIQAIDVCLEAGMEVIILDSISHCWEYLLDFHSKMAGNSFTNWQKISPMQNAFINKILQADAHIIATMRTKQDYVLNNKNGKFVPEKVGLKAVQRNDLDFEFTIVFDIDIKHFVSALHCLSRIFSGKPEFIINSATGKKILDWCNNGTSLDEVRNQIKKCDDIEKLRLLYKQYYTMKDLEEDFKLQKETIQSKKQLLNPQNISSNGISTSQQE